MAIAFGSQGMEGIDGKRKAPKGSGTGRKYVLVGVGMALLEEVRHCWCGL